MFCHGVFFEVRQELTIYSKNASDSRVIEWKARCVSTEFQPFKNYLLNVVEHVSDVVDYLIFGHMIHLCVKARNWLSQKLEVGCLTLTYGVCGQVCLSVPALAAHS